MFKAVKIREGHDNFFTPLRLLFAALVLVGHAFIIGNRDASAEPLIFFDYSFSYLAVNAFFIASGFLVTKSMLYRGDSAEYSSARLLRIYPALIVHVLFVMFIIGPLATKLPLREFFTDPQFFMQPLWVFSFYETKMVLPGAFLDNHEPYGSIPLWTLRYEVLAYIGTGLIFMLGFMKRKWMLLAQFILPCVAYITAKETGVYDTLPATGQNLLRFGIAYGLGAAIFAYQDRLSFNLLGLIFISALTVLVQSTTLNEVGMNLMLGYFIFFIAYQQAPKWQWLGSIDDLSYGIYIYHWCVLQMLAMYFPSMSILALVGVGLIITTSLAFLSWHVIEKPMLSNKKSFARFLRLGKAKPIYDAKTVLLD